MARLLPACQQDPAELRYEFLKLMAQEIDFSARVVVGRKIPAIYQQRHNRQPREFYADLMSHLLKYSGKIDPLILDVRARQQHVEPQPSACSVDIAQQRSRRGTVTHELRNTTKFNVQPYDHEILLALADYSLWTVQRVYEKGDEKFFGLLEPKIVLVHDVYDSSVFQSETIIGRNTIL